MKLNKNDIVVGYLGWCAKVLTAGKVLRLRWLDGPLRGRAARVPAEFVKLGVKGR